MPIIKSAAKKMRVDARRAAHNLGIKSRMKTAVKKAEGSRKFADISMAYSAIDRAVKARLVHKNLAAREKGRLSKLAKPVKLAAEKVTKTTKKAVKTKITKKPAKKASPKPKSKTTSKR